ncbi:Rossmann-fold NAD(P)-binding domain-containing protein [Sphingobacteruim zhuxiongii]|nr:MULTISPECIES: GDP-L-fucose synthase [unclassified Sphingobacterium]
MMKHLLILGCGWFAEELAKLYQSKGWQVWATTTQQEKYHRLKGDGIFAYTHNFDDEAELDLPFEIRFDLVLNSIPATSKNSIEDLGFRFYQVFKLLSTISYDRHFYLSSVGVYPDIDAIFDESYADEEQMISRLRLAEKRMQSLPSTTVFRLGGLFGKQRIFAKYFQNKVVTTGDQPANFIHLDDVLGLIEAAIDQHISGGIYNVVCPEHPSKKEVIMRSAQKYLLEYPAGFDPKERFQKIINGSKLPALLNYTYKYRSPLDF